MSRRPSRSLPGRLRPGPRPLRPRVLRFGCALCPAGLHLPPRPYRTPRSAAPARRPRWTVCPDVLVLTEPPQGLTPAAPRRSSAPRHHRSAPAGEAPPSSQQTLLQPLLGPARDSGSDSGLSRAPWTAHTGPTAEGSSVHMDPSSCPRVAHRPQLLQPTGRALRSCLCHAHVPGDPSTGSLPFLVRFVFLLLGTVCSHLLLIFFFFQILFIYLKNLFSVSRL